LKPKGQLEVSDRDGVVLASFLGKNCLGEQAVADLGAECARLAGSQPVVVLDCSRLEHLGSAALKVLVRLHKVLKKRGGGLTLCRLPPVLREVFGITRLDHFFAVADSLEAALAGLAGLSAEPAPPCALCAWPRAARCLVCGTGFCDEHGWPLSRLCGKHRWLGWLATAAFVGGAALLGALLRG
jgi:anti-anti-sigma factor